MSKNQAVDRSVGLFVTIVGAIAIAYTVTVIRQHLQESTKDPQTKEKQSEDVKKGDDCIPGLQTPARDHLVVHQGTCHCTRVQFKILGPKQLQAHDITTKLRFPRVSVLYQDFELLTHPSVLSMYTVQQSQGVHHKSAAASSPHQYYLPGTSHLFSEAEQLYDSNEGNGSNAEANGIYSFCSYCGMHVIYAPGLDPVEIQINVDCLQSIDGHLRMHDEVANAATLLDKRGIGCAPSPLYPLLYNRYQPSNSHQQPSQYLADPVDVVSEPFSDTTEDMYLRQQQQQRDHVMYYQHKSSNHHHNSHHKKSHRKHRHGSSGNRSPPHVSNASFEDEEGSMSSSNSMESHLDLKSGPSRFHSFHSPQRYVSQHSPSHASINMSAVNAANVDHSLDLFQQLYPYSSTGVGVNVNITSGSVDGHGMASVKDYDDWYSIPSPMVTPDRNHLHHETEQAHNQRRHRSSPRMSSAHSTPMSSPLAAAIPRVSNALRPSSDVIDADLVVHLPNFKKHLNRHLKASDMSMSTNSSVVSSALETN